MDIKPITGSEVVKAIENLDKKLPENNPSIFIQECEDTALDENFLFQQLYT